MDLGHRLRPRGRNRYAPMQEFNQAKQDAHELYHERLYEADYRFYGDKNRLIID